MRTAVFLLVAWSMTALLAAPAFGDDFAEGNAWEWGTFASDGAYTEVSDDEERVKVGWQSIRFVTESGFDTGVTYPDSADAHWDLLGFTHLTYWAYAINETPYGFQGNQPVIELVTATGTFRYEPRSMEMYNRAWHLYHIPLEGDDHWVRTSDGSPSMDDVLQIVIHQDTWDAGFTVYYDGVEFIEMEPGGTPPSGPEPPPGVEADAVPVKALLFVFDPVFEGRGGLPRSQAFGWGDPEALTQQVVADLEASSHGRLQYEVVETVVVDDFPVFKDGYRYDEAAYEQAWSTGVWHEAGFDYARFIADLNLAARVERGEIDEVFLYGAPGDGFWESTMAGDGGYWCNSGPVEGVPSERLFVLMGWNYERGVAEALHSWGHRAESIMRHHYGEWLPNRENTWNAFTLQDRQVPDEGSIGNVHFPVNGQWDYDYANPRFVFSDCDDWYTYPDLPGNRRYINYEEWSPDGFEVQRDYLNWWYDHMPHMTGKGYDQYLANWWRYLGDPEQFKGWDGNLYYSSGFGDVVITEPADDADVGGVVTVRVRVTMDGAAGRVDLYADGAYYDSDFVAPYVFEWDASSLTGQHTLEAYAYELQNGTESASDLVAVHVQSPGLTPGEVSPPGAASPLVFSDATTLAWEDAAASGAEWFNVYRGNVPWLRDGVGGSCRATGLSVSAFEDPDVPWAGAAWFYVVTGENTGGEGTRGSASNSVERLAEPTCH